MARRAATGSAFPLRESSCGSLHSKELRVSACVSGPKRARTPSPARSFTVPSKDSITPIMRATASATMSLSSSGSSRSPSAVEPTRSAKSAVTTRRSSRGAEPSMESIVAASCGAVHSHRSAKRRFQCGHARDHPAWDVRDCAETVFLRKDLLRDRHDLRLVAHEEAGGPHEIVGAPFRSFVLFGVCPSVLPRDQHDRRLAHLLLPLGALFVR